MRFKLVAGEGHKMLAHIGDTGKPYNVGALSLKGGPLFIAEGEPDTWTGHECGMNTVGFPGATNWRRLYRRILRHYDVVILAHGDEAGLGFAEKVAKDLHGSAASCKIKQFPDKTDLNDIYIQVGSAATREWVGLDE